MAEANAGHGTVKTVLWHNGKWVPFPGESEKVPVMKLTTYHQFKSGYRMIGNKTLSPLYLQGIQRDNLN